MAIPNNKREKKRPFYGKRNDGNHTTARGCLFCEHSDHKAIDCDNIVSVEQRKKIFLDKRLCFNWLFLCFNLTNKPKGPLSIDEVKRHKTFLVKRAQQQGFNNVSFEQGQAQLNLQPNEEGVLKCRGRIQGEYPVYLPDTALLAAKIVWHAHITKLHGGVGLTMASEESCKKLQWLQTVSSHSFRRSATSTFAKRKNRRQHCLQRDWCGFCRTGEVL